jgi:thiosulfate dehydrogenase
MLKGFILGVLATIAAALCGGYALLYSGAIPANADAPPNVVEKWAARKSLKATIRRGARQGPPSMQATPENLAAGLELYAVHCAVCHGAADGKASAIARGLYQRAPQLGRHGVEDDPEGETYWIIHHGVRLTGMPSFGASLTEDQVWQLTLFLKHMDELPPAVAAAWKKLPSQAR